MLLRPIYVALSACLLVEMHFVIIKCMRRVGAFHVLHWSIYIIDTFMTKDWAQLHTWLAPMGLCVCAFLQTGDGVCCWICVMYSKAFRGTRVAALSLSASSHWDPGHLSDAVQERVVTRSVAYHILSSYIKRRFHIKDANYRPVLVLHTWAIMIVAANCSCLSTKKKRRGLVSADWYPL